jgi:hypothetical protein
MKTTRIEPVNVQKALHHVVTWLCMTNLSKKSKISYVGLQRHYLSLLPCWQHRLPRVDETPRRDVVHVLYASLLVIHQWGPKPTYGPKHLYESAMRRVLVKANDALVHRVRPDGPFLMRAVMHFYSLLSNPYVQKAPGGCRYMCSYHRPLGFRRRELMWMRQGRVLARDILRQQYASMHLRNVLVGWADADSSIVSRCVRAWEGDMDTSEYQKRLSVMALVDPWTLITPGMRKHWQPVFNTFSAAQALPIPLFPIDVL